MVDRIISHTHDLIESVRKAALAVGRLIFCSMAIIVAAHISLFTLQRVERRLFTPMAFTVSSALLGALLLSLALAMSSYTKVGLVVLTALVDSLVGYI